MVQTNPTASLTKTNNDLAVNHSIIEFCIICHRAKDASGEWLYMDNEQRAGQNVHNGFCEDCSSLWGVKL